MECAYHSDREAVSECSKCGRPLCEECSSENNTCEDCLAQSKFSATAGKRLLFSWDAWLYSFLTPKTVFKAAREGASFAGVAMNLLVGFVNAGVIAFLLVLIAGRPFIDAFDYTTQFIIFICVWLINSFVSYSFAMLAGGTGSIKRHLYLLSLFIPLSPVAFLLIAVFLNSLISLHISLGILGTVIIAVHLLNVQIAAVKETHNFGTLQAAVTAVVPMIISGVVVGLLIFVFSRK